MKHQPNLGLSYMLVTQALNKILRRIPAWLIYPVALAYAAWLFWLGVTGGLGAEPIRALERALGRPTLYLLVGGLAITPLRQLFGLNLIKFRRAVGLSCFFFVCLHLLVWLVLDVQDPGRIWADIVKRPYVTGGMAGFTLLIPLALTSNNWSLRKLGPVRWRRLHRLVYPAAILGGVHYLLLVKGWQLRPMVFLAVIVLLLALRYKKTRRRAVVNG
ncbi:Protein-methionine-sulfoxide reductase heme-binding subunit MsrQ [hydrothermal vent metagenome]|uniref:Protein-methionine-sulfoxide reductase heme-binding subunit MsrQ n=1 Tax=hydrothermal vent metagenome TaxID=652676 RepID=A0A3B0R829_9ZZZZ